MSLNGMMAAALSGLQTAQTAITTVSNNITNVNTPGYVREVVDQSPLVLGGIGVGVTADQVRRVTNSFLEQTSYQAAASAGSAAIVGNLINQAQAAFGDPSKASSYLNQLGVVFSDFTAAANDPASSLPRNQIVGDLSTFLDNTANVASTLSGLNNQADAQISSDVTQVNQLLTQIGSLNANVETALADGGDAAASQDNQSQLLNKLSSLMAINVSTQSNGTIAVRSSNGQLLVGDGAEATLTYTPATTGLGAISIVPAGGFNASTLEVGDGELKGLLSLRNNIIPGLQAQLSQYVGGAANALNAASNASTAVPPPQTLTGRDTGLDLPTIVGDFSGTTNIAIVNASGALQTQVQVNFTTDQISVNGGAATGFTPANFLTSLNTALGANGSASFTGGALSISAATAGSGVAISDDPNTPARDGGQGFSQFFGLNSLLTSGQITNFNTGLKATDNNGFTPGGTLTLQFGDANGTLLGQATVTVPAAGSPTVQDLVNALNAGASGFGSFSLTSQGALTFSPSSPGTTLSVSQDATQRGAGGPTVSQLFGLGAAQAATVASAFQINPGVAANPATMPLARLNLSAPAGTPVVAIGDGSGAQALAAAANQAIGFSAAGTLPAMTTSITQYAANLAGAIGQQSKAADTADTAAAALQTETQTRLQSVEGVNLDEELVNLTTYQQAYNASARLIQANQNMIQSLLNMVP
ncbi:MAG: flagellar hook-associated protein FlgK [Caulobacteraceae bacterium]